MTDSNGVNINKVFIAGRLTRDPEARTMPSGKIVVNLGVATNRFWTSQSGEKQKETEFHNVVLFGRNAEVAKQYLTKGGILFVEGRIQTRNWQAQDGTKRYKTEVIANNIQLGPRSYSSSGGQHSEQGNFNQNGNNQPSSPVPPQNELETIEYPEEDINPEDIPF